MKNPFPKRAILLGGVLVGLWFIGGCGEGSTGVSLSGKVTFKENPVPAGKIYFQPDKGNTGNEGFATITNGQYDTKENGRGASPGSNMVKIEGYDAPGGNMLFKHTILEDIAADQTTLDIEVPDEAAKNVPKNTGPPP